MNSLRHRPCTAAAVASLKIVGWRYENDVRDSAGALGSGWPCVGLLTRPGRFPICNQRLPGPAVVLRRLLSCLGRLPPATPRSQWTGRTGSRGMATFRRSSCPGPPSARHSMTLESAATQRGSVQRHPFLTTRVFPSNEGDQDARDVGYCKEQWHCSALPPAPGGRSFWDGSTSNLM